MTKLGLWKPFMSEQEIRSWYRLPATLAAECQSYAPNGHELDPLSSGDFSALRKRLVAFTNKSVAPFKPPQHNSRHFLDTEENGLDAADVYAGRDKRKMPVALRQHFGNALYAHDLGHCASTFRSKAPRGIYRPDLGVGVSSEWVSALVLNEFMRREGVSLPARLFQTGVIYASTYGAGTPIGKALEIPSPKPITVWGGIMRAADVCPAKKFEENTRRSVALLYGEVPAFPSARSWEAYVLGELNFTKYVAGAFVHMDALAQKDISDTLGWRNRLRAWQSGLKKLQDPRSRESRILHAELRKYNVSLA
jgi:hypothetical protein